MNSQTSDIVPSELEMVLSSVFRSGLSVAVCTAVNPLSLMGLDQGAHSAARAPPPLGQLTLVLVLWDLPSHSACVTQRS